VSRTRSAAAGAAAAILWAASERIDMEVFRNDYSDVALLGKFATRSRAWPLAGLAIHAMNGALFGLAFNEARRRTRVAPVPLGVGLALAEHVALFPLGALVDRFHPARGEAGVVDVFSRPAFAQATLRHAQFGLTLGRLAG
jgi:hypothetical protein